MENLHKWILCPHKQKKTLFLKIIKQTGGSVVITKYNTHSQPYNTWSERCRLYKQLSVCDECECASVCVCVHDVICLLFTLAAKFQFSFQTANEQLNIRDER